MSNFSDLPNDLATALTAETKGEIIRWAGRPDARAAFLASFAIYIVGIPWMLISLPICGVMLLAIMTGPPATRTVSIFELGMTAFGFLFALCFVLIGVYLLLVPFTALRRARRTVFAVTDRRILTIVEDKRRSVTTILPEKVLKLERKENRDGSGVLNITIGHEKDSDGATVAKSEDFYGVPNVAEAQRAIAELIRTRRT